VDDDAFAPEPVDDACARAWGDAVGREFDAALAMLDHRVGEDHALAPTLRWLAARRARVHGLLPGLASAGVGSLLTRVHGDFHLGQVLVAQGDAYLIDFEGEPARPLAQRRAKGSPLRDVAGLLRSFDYAASVFAHGEDGVAPVDDGSLGEFLLAFRTHATAAFLGGYRSVLARAQVPWIAPAAVEPLTDLFLVEKAVYEIGYEAAHRPHWLGMPVEGLVQLVRRLLREHGDD
jgi:maltose alpha-D-glucosyltransferase/alpha-amylase